MARGPVARLRSTVDRGSADKRARRHLVSMWHVGAGARRCSPMAADDDEPEGFSLEYERRWRGDTTEAKNGDSLSLA
jgi:hypothetical protein